MVAPVPEPTQITAVGNAFYVRRIALCVAGVVS